MHETIKRVRFTHAILAEKTNIEAEQALPRTNVSELGHPAPKQQRGDAPPF